ncbi:prolipoprotein diacylglyceryl transferase family protein [Tunturiibacter empetritectus]|uniref:prolipoprotein diacylglyceryl transferase family protein n=1 Tax=Tunturiibacter empetritectus TaxID=3069691 RepID=UPI003D9AD46C
MAHALCEPRSRRIPVFRLRKFRRAPLPPPLRPSPPPHLRRTRRTWPHGRTHTQPPHRRPRRPQPRQPLERRPLHPPLRLRSLPHPSHRHQSPQLPRLSHPSAHGTLPHLHRNPPHPSSHADLSPHPQPPAPRHPRRLEPPAALIWAFLALGHFAEGSDAGLPTTLPWGIHIPPIRIPPDHTRLHPVALYAAIAAAILTLLLLRQLKHRRQPGDTVALALASAGTLQFLLTFVRQPYPYTSSATYILLDPIQWIALGMIVVAAIILLLPRKLVTHAV